MPLHVLTGISPQILDTLEGLRYLHTLDPPVVHGGLKSVSFRLNRAVRVSLRPASTF